MQITVSKKKAAACLAGTLALFACAGIASVAFAADGATSADSDCESACIPAALVSTDGYVTGAATRAAGPALEILGLASVEESGQFVDTTNWYSWSQPKYWLAASYCNSSLSPYLANLAYTDLNSESDADGYEAAVLNTSRAGGGNGPNASLEALGGSDETDQAVWALDPDVVVGTGGDVEYEKYGATGVEYSFSNYTSLVETMYLIAGAADDAALSDDTENDDGTTDLNDELRYGSATEIAEQYEEYIFGTIGYVAEAINSGEQAKKTVALVQSVTENDDGSYTYNCLTDAGSSAGDGTAASNRYLETTSANGLDEALDLAYNLVGEGNADADATIAVTASELAEADLILVGGQQSSSGTTDIVDILDGAGLLSKTYAVYGDGSEGAMYGVVMNSVENAQNIGRILGCLYPDLVNQQSWLAYYYENFYHVTSKCMGCTMSNALEGVRCWAADSDEEFEWGADYVGYSSNVDADAVEEVLDSGFTYYQGVVGSGSTDSE